MTKWGMPGVYTYAFMDGWSPGYLGSVAYNHNGMMRMYETQSGREGGSGTPAAARRRQRGRRGRSAAGAARRRQRARAVAVAALRARTRRRAAAAGARRRARRTPAAARRSGGSSGSPRTARPRRRTQPLGAPGGGRERRVHPPSRPAAAADSRASGIAASPFRRTRSQNFTRRDNTNYMETGVLSGLQLTSMFPELVLENFYVKTRNSLDAGATRAPYGYVFPVQRDMTQGRDARQHPARAGHRSRHSSPRRSRAARTRSPPGPTWSSSTSRTAASRRTCSRSRTIRTPRSRRTTTAAGRWAGRSTST